MYVNFLFDLLVVVVVYLFWILFFKKKNIHCDLNIGFYLCIIVVLPFVIFIM